MLRHPVQLLIADLHKCSPGLSQGMRDAYAELAPLIQQHFSNEMQAGSSAGSSVSISNASQASCMSTSGSGSSGTTTSSGIGSDTGGGSSSAGSSSSSSSDGSAAWAAAQALVRQHISGPSAADCLQQAEALWPQWSAAGCRLAAAPRPAGAQPTPDEAAAVLQAVARRALPLPPAQRQQQLAKSRCVRGLIEALRLTPPRHTAAAGSKQPSVASSSSGGDGNGCGGSSVAALSSAGAVAAALWALAVLGGSIWWEAEAEALCCLLPGCRFATLREVRCKRIPAGASRSLLWGCCSCSMLVGGPVAATQGLPSMLLPHPAQP